MANNLNSSLLVVPHLGKKLIQISSLGLGQIQSQTMKDYSDVYVDFKVNTYYYLGIGCYFGWIVQFLWYEWIIF